jgi:MtN3 and saliva related transmembrane protein
MDTTQLVGIAAGVLTAISMLPQLIKTIKEKKAEAISLKMLLVLVSGLILWLVYGILKNDLPIIATNGFSILINALMIFFRIRYKDK